MPKFRMSPTDCGIVVALTIAALLAMVSRSVFVVGIVGSATGIVVLAAAVVAIVRRDGVGTYCIGFAVFAGTYFFGVTLGSDNRDSIFSAPTQLFFAAMDVLPERPLARGTLEDSIGRYGDMQEMMAALYSMQSFVALILGVVGGALARSNSTRKYES